MREVIYRNYYPIENHKDVTDLRVELYYSLGGENYFICKEEPRGYYLSITPVKRDGICESFVAFSGQKMLIQPCSRKSASMERQAIQKVIENEYEASLRHDVCIKNGIKI